jgi:hypothetical protein
MKWLALLLLLLTACSLFQSDVEKLQGKIDKTLEKNPVYVNSQFCVLADKGEFIQTECIPELVVSKNETAVVINSCDEQNCTKLVHPLVSIPKPAGLALVDNSIVARVMTCGTMYEHKLLGKKRYEAVESKDFDSAFEFTLEDCDNKPEQFNTMCIQCVAATRQDPEICSRITEMGIWSSPKDECVMIVAQVSNSTKICSKIADEDMQKFCRMRVEMPGQ